MKNSIKYLAISILCLFCIDAKACWHGWSMPQYYYMYRVYEGDNIPVHNNVDRNCKEWEQFLQEYDKWIPRSLIYEVIYEMPLNEVTEFYEKGCSEGNLYTVGKLKMDQELMDYLLLAKQNEHIRTKHLSKWYYPTMKIDAPLMLEDIVDKALNIDSKRLRTRYLLQAVRALFTLGDYERCIDIWHKEVEKLPVDDLMRNMIQPYIAGAEFRLSHTDKAIEYFAEIGDIESVQFCMGRKGEKYSELDALELVSKTKSDSPYITRTLQNMVRKIENNGEWRSWSDSLCIDKSKRLLDLSLRMIQEEKVTGKAVWYYTAAFLYDVLGDVQKASSMISWAEKAKCSELLQESIKIFRIYIDAKTSTYNSNYEQKLYKQLRWLDNKIVNNIDNEVITETAEGWNLMGNFSYYYWNDMLRRIILGEVCPRMIEAGKHTKALQLANMADNRLLQIVDKKKVDISYWDKNTGRYVDADTLITMADYRKGSYYNRHDYRNSFFEMIDTIGIDRAIAYYNNVKTSKNNFDLFLNSRGHTSNDYLCDIVGTQCLRDMRYDKAEYYLSLISEQVTDLPNTSAYYDIDPFDDPAIFWTQGQTIKYSKHYKLNFARRMNYLENEILRNHDADKDAVMIMEFSKGLRNSFGKCWSLTHYHYGTNYYGIQTPDGLKREWWEEPYVTKARNISNSLVKISINIARDPEILAKLHYELHHYITVAEKYPETEMGRLVLSKCDGILDYKGK